MSQPDARSTDLAPPKPPCPEASPRVLIVDDDRSMRMLLALAMEEEGYQTLEARDGEQGLEEFQRSRPDMILLDAVMPGMDGIECCRQLRAMAGGDRVPILIVTVLDDRESVDRAFEAGATDYITKPIYWPVLCQRVRRLLEANQSQDKARRTGEQIEALQAWAAVVDALGKLLSNQGAPAASGGERPYSLDPAGAVPAPPVRAVPLDALAPVLTIARAAFGAEGLGVVYWGAARSPEGFWIDDGQTVAPPFGALAAAAIAWPLADHPQPRILTWPPPFPAAQTLLRACQGEQVAIAPLGAWGMLVARLPETARWTPDGALGRWHTLSHLLAYALGAPRLGPMAPPPAAVPGPPAPCHPPPTEAPCS
jgi:CheY-like chemotaxis protein